ncbi:polymorphic toxin-type HINT domain-containing protein [Haemophilus sputorum]
MYAGKDYRQTSAEILSKDKASINAQNIIVDSAFNTDKYKQSESDLKFGQFTRVKSPIIDLINSIESTIKNKNASDRVQAANIMSVAAQAYNLASAFQGQGGASYLIRVESGTGVAHSRKKEDSYQHTSQGNLFNAKEIEFTARGDGSTNAQGNPQLGNINITHADITSVDEKGNRLKDSSVTFNANNLTIDPGKSTVDQHARSQSAGVEVGMAATIGAQTGIGIYARVGGSSSKTNVEGVNYTNSHLNTETLNINTQGDTTLTGTTAKAKTINANVGGNLNIASVQDENKFETKSSGGGLEVEFGWGNNWRVSGYANSEKGESGYKQVKEQAGLFAEEGGYHVNAKNVHLKGAAITSTNPVNSELATNKLTFEDIQNESHSDAMSMSFSASYSRSGGAPKDNSSSGGSPFSQIGSKMKDSFSSNGPTSSSTNFGGGLPMNESDSDNSVTRATLTEGKITLNKDTAPTQTTAQALGINTDINQANGEVDKPKDVNQILSEQRQISAAAGNIKSAVNTYIETQRAPLLKEVARLEEEKQALEARQDKAGAEAVAEQLAIVKNEAEQWSVGGKHYRKANAITSTIIGALSGQSITSIATAAASPYVNAGIKNATTNEEGEVNTVANIAAHALWGAVEAKALGGSGTSGALAAGIAELSAPVAAKLSQIINEVSSDESLPSTTAKMKAIVNKIKAIDKITNTNELSNKEKEILVGITSVIGQVVAQVTSIAKGADSDTASKNVKIGGIVAKNAVANNYLSRTEIEQYYKDLKDCNGKEECEKDVKQRNIALSAKHTEELELACGGDKRSSAECSEHREKARDGLKAARFNEYKVQSAALDKSNEIPEIADSALEKSNEIPKTAGSALVEERVDLPEVVVRGTATPKYELDIKSLVYHDNLSDIAYAEPNRANAEAIREVLYANYFPNSNQPARIETYFRDFADVLRYNIQDKRPRVEGYLHNKIIDSVINNTLNEKNNSVWNKPLSQIPGELNQVVYKSVGRGLDKFAVGTVSAIYDLSLLADEVRNAPFRLLVDSDYRNKVTTSADNYAKLVNKLVTDNEYRENVINYVTDVAKNKVDNVGELLKQGNPGDLAEIGSDIVSIAADFAPIGAAGKLGKVSDGLGDLGKAADKIHDVANVGRGADKVHDVTNVAKATEQLKTCSFRGDMEVKTEQGYKPIQSIKVGDKVYAKNELTGQMSYQHVQAHYNNPYDFTVYVEVIDEQGKHQTIVSNKIHPFFTQVNQGELVASSEGHFYKGEIQNAQWVDAQNLKAGYKLLSENNHWQTVKDVSIKAEKLSAYNLTVENDHTYFIKGANSDSDGVWVHNDCWHALPDGAQRIGEIEGYHAYKFKNQDGKEITVIKKDLNRFETVNHKAGKDPHFNRLSQLIDEKTGRYLSTDKPVDQLYNRSYLRSDTMKKIFEQYEALPNGDYRDKITRAIIKGPIDIGHAYGWEHRRLSLAAKELNWSQKQFNDYVNARPNKFRLENMSENRSHRNEMPGKDDIERIVRDMKNFERGK